MKPMAMTVQNAVRVRVMLFAERTVHAKAGWLTIEKAACCYSAFLVAHEASFVSR